MKRMLPVVLLTTTSIVHAADVYQPAPIHLSDSWDLTPKVAVGLGFDDNTANSNSGEIDSWFWRIAPELLLHAGDDNNNYQIDYRMVDGNYFSSSEDDFTDHSLKFAVEHHFTRRHRIDAHYQYRREHESRGEGITEGQGLAVDEVAEMDVQDAALVYGFGREAARINLDFELGYYDKDYDNLKNISQYSDYSTERARVTMYWRLGSRTRLLGEWNGYDTEYDDDPINAPERGSKSYRLFAGVTWEATSKTSGTIKLGYEERDFDSSEREDFDGLAWQASVDYQPRTYSTFTLTSGGRAKDPDTFGDYIEETTLGLAWNHQWRPRLSTFTSVQYVGEEFTGFDRDDDMYKAKVGVSMAWKRWLASDFSYEFVDQDSNIEVAKYDKNIFLASLRISL
ncbi:outer membrane beta-barrel protein [Ferrimonas lipolytica]|uniref:Outer membrane beta-barrel protein n=1 Tax=Ferrimonas lipolytica TaxID=2724191 RepID=A0A6H1UKX3_9GAMM|nr:outer membrane beta-barrel protein [Ferrimonas lipolytica]QIZ78452.1 outer membrane beta-barrel protein [Ferrimonas lipolytica]